MSAKKKVQAKEAEKIDKKAWVNNWNQIAAKEGLSVATAWVSPK